MWKGFTLLLAALSLAMGLGESAWAQGRCDNCDLPPGCRGNGNGNGNNNGNGNRNRNQNCDPLEVEIQADIDFGRLVLIGDGVGRVVIDLNTGKKLVSGELDDLGGMAVQGEALITGAPGEIVNVSIPGRVTMTDPAGGQAELRDFETDLPALARLDSNGQLTFRFTATLYTDAKTAMGGNLRARIPISVEYD